MLGRLSVHSEERHDDPERPTLRSFAFRTAPLAQRRRPACAGARPLADGEVRLRIDSFALTSNNITYAAFGDAMKYWEFFPTGDPAWGCIPVWGFADVVESRAEGVAVGRASVRLPARWADYLVVQPGRVGQRGFVDARRRTAAPGRGLQPVHTLRDRPGIRRRSRRHTGGAATAVHDLVPDRRLPGRRAVLRRDAGAAVQRIEQDRVRHRVLPVATARRTRTRRACSA